MDIATPTLERITELALRQKQLEGTLEDLAKQAKEVNEQLEQVRGGYRVEGQLPLAMQEAGVEELRLVGGALVKVNAGARWRSCLRLLLRHAQLPETPASAGP